jgi:hypothetical protein
LLAAALTGCAGGPDTSPGGGARDAAVAYFDCLVRQDWPGAYAALDPESRHRCSPEEFSRWAQSYRASLGFEPERTQVRAASERDDEATVHVVLTGTAAGRQRRYKDAVRLRRGESGWEVVLQLQRESE